MPRLHRRILAIAITVLLAAAAVPVAAGQTGGGDAAGAPSVAPPSPATAAASPGNGKGNAKGHDKKGGPKPRSSDAAPAPIDYLALAPTLSQRDFPKITREALDVPMADGTELYVEVVRPDPTAYGNGPWPVILEASPYHGTLADRDGTRIFPAPVDPAGRPIGLTGYFAPRGYAVVMVDLRGTGRSGGCLDHLGPKDARDLAEIVEWAAHPSRGWSNGRVGMTGHSYVGSTPTVAAAQQPKGLVTIVPSAGLASMYDHQFNKGVPWSLQWIGPQVAYEALALSRHLPPGLEVVLDEIYNPFGATGDNVGNDMETVGCGLPQSAIFAGSGQATGQYEGWHEARDWRAAAAAVDIPIFMIHGVHDNAARIPAAEWFFGHRFDRPGDKVWIGQWDHGHPANTRCASRSGSRAADPTCRFEQFQYALHAWFDKHLKQLDVETGPAVEVFLNGRRPVDVRTVIDPETLRQKAFAQGAWTEPTAWLNLHPDANDMSLRFAPPGKPGSATFGTAADAVVASARAQRAVFRSEPLPTDTVLLGLPEMQLDVAASYGQVVDIVTTLWREDTHGNRQQVSYCAIQPQLRNGVETLSPVVPGEEMRLEPQCFTAAQWVPQGHRLVLEVATTSQHHASRGSDSSMTVFTGPGRSSYRLPTAPDAVLVDDVPLTSAGALALPPVGPAQDTIVDSIEIGGPRVGLTGDADVLFPFTWKDGFDNASMTVTITDLAGDVDVHLERKKADGAWAPAEGTTGGGTFDVTGPEILRSGRLPSGDYRLRIHNFLSVPAEVKVVIRWVNQDGEPGADPA